MRVWDEVRGKARRLKSQISSLPSFSRVLRTIYWVVILQHLLHSLFYPPFFLDLLDSHRTVASLPKVPNPPQGLPVLSSPVIADTLTTSSHFSLSLSHTKHTACKMAPSSTTVNVVSKDDARLRTILETKSLRFHIKTGDCKWECTVLDRATQ